MTLATVLVPTLEHASTLGAAVRSALAQEARDLEIIVVGDGATPEVEAEARLLEREDNRVRWVPFPKGERHGEANRHQALGQARGGIVLYLSDDDLWLPDHVGEMSKLLSGREGLAHTLPVEILDDGRVAQLKGTTLDIARGKNHVPLSAMGHTMASYRALPVGWSPAPPNVYTDLHMWMKFLRFGFWIEFSARPTVVHLAAARRRGWSQEARAAEQALWDILIRRDPDGARRVLLGTVPTPFQDPRAPWPSDPSRKA